MAEPTTARAGVAVLRVWREDGSPQVRARLTTVDDVREPGPGTVRWAGAGTDAVVEQVRSWLDEWARASG